MQMSYWRFAAMIATSTLVMFGLMYIHTYMWDHAYFSETRAWMAVLMGAVMAIIMLGFMLNMYKRRAVNIAIFVGAALAFTLATWLVRSQVTVSDTDYLQAMIPHHSIAILTSERARIADPRVRQLADEIVESQRKEIAEMKYLIRAVEREGVQAAREPASQAEPASVSEAIRSADLATTDLEPITDAELQRMLGSGAVCRFTYGPDEAAVAVATSPAAGASRGGMSWFRGFAGGLVSGVLVMIRKRIPVLPALAAATPALPIGPAIGRIECFLVGDDNSTNPQIKSSSSRVSRRRPELYECAPNP